MLCCGYTLTDFPISIKLTSLALWQSNDCPSASKATLMNMDKYFMWIHYERLHNHNKAKHNKTVCIFLGIYCILHSRTSFVMLTRNILEFFVLWSERTRIVKQFVVVCWNTRRTFRWRHDRNKPTRVTFDYRTPLGPSNQGYMTDLLILHIWHGIYPTNIYMIVSCVLALFKS